MELDKKHQWMVMLALGSALFMEFLDATALNTSLPRIAYDFSLNPLYLKIAVTSYLLSVGLLLPLSGFLSQAIGMKRLYMLANIVFMLGSIGCAFSVGIVSLTVFRIIQGVGGAFLAPVYRLMMVKIYSKAELPKAQSTVAVIVSLGLVLGPLLGGALTTYLSWRYIFWINVPIVILTLMICHKFLPKFVTAARRKLDFFSFFCMAIMLVSLLIFFDFLPSPEAPKMLKTGLLLLGVIALMGYVFCTRNRGHPLFPRELWGKLNIVRLVSASFLARLGFNAVPFLLPLMLQVGFAYSPFQAGLVMLAVAFGVIVAKVFTSPLGKRFDRITSTRVLCCLLSLTMFGLAFLANDFSRPVLLGVLVCFGALQGTIATFMNVSIYVQAPKALLPDAVVLNSMSTQLSGSFAVAIAAAFMVLHIGLDALAGHHIPLPTFHAVFLFVAIFPLMSLLMLWRLKTPQS